MLEAFEPVLIRTPGETSQAKNRKNLPTTYGGMRQTCMHAKMATANAAMLAADGIGSNMINATPRRGGERIETLSCVIRIAAPVQ
jgi:ABC-type proline/glycine betaine transport system permease subunit